MAGINIQYLFYAGLFLGVLLLVEGLYYLLVGSRTSEKAVNRRLKMLAAGGSSREVLEDLRRNPIGIPQEGGLRIFKLSDFEDLIGQAGVVMPMGRVLAIMGSVGVTTTLLFSTLVNLEVEHGDSNQLIVTTTFDSFTCDQRNTTSDEL